jgi:TPR repeat protein
LDEKQAATYFKLASDQGDLHGAVNYGLCLMNGRGISSDTVEAVRYFRRAANGNDATVQGLLRIYHYLGVGCCVDITESAELLKMAADAGDAQVQFNHGVLLAEFERNLRDASIYIEMSADQGFASRQVNYGICRSEGLGVLVDYVEAMQYLRAAAESGDSYGKLHYGLCLLDEKGTKRDTREAFEYCARSATRPNSNSNANVNAEAKVNLGFCFHEGVGVARSHVKSGKYFKEAADAGNAVGQFNYGLCCYRGERALYDFREASESLNKPQNKGYVPAIHAFVVCLRDGRIRSRGLSDIIF